MPKCPACKFDSPEGAAWCDFCKEPFQKKAKPHPEAPPAPRPEAAPPANLGELKKLTPEELFKRLPAELSKDAAADQAIPRLPPWFRPLAYCILALLAVMMASLIMITVMKAGHVRTAHKVPRAAS